MKFGNLLNFAISKSKPKDLGKETALTGYASSMYGANWPQYNPDNLIARKGYDIYSQMMLDEQCKAVIKFRRNAVTGREWKFECDYEAISPEEAEYREKLFTHIISELPKSFKARLDGIMTSMVYGHSVTEIVLNMLEYGGKTYYGIARLAKKSAETFTFRLDEYGNLVGLVQSIGTLETELDPTKFILHTHNSDEDEYYGRSELREAYRAWFSKDMAYRFRNIHIERAATGYLVVNQLPTSDLQVIPGTKMYRDLTAILSNLKSTTSILLPKGLEAKLVEFRDNEFYSRAINEDNRAIAKALLMPDMVGISNDNKSGNRALGDTQLEAFLWMLDAEAKELEETLNEQLFKKLGKLNFDDEYYPKFKLLPLSESQKLRLVETWATMVSAGAVSPSTSDEAHIRDLMKFPENSGESNADANSTVPAANSDSVNNGADGTSGGAKPIPDARTPVKGVSAPPKTNKFTAAFSTSEKRVDFQKIDKSANIIEYATSNAILDSMSAALKDMMTKVLELPLTDPVESKSIKYPVTDIADIRKAFKKSLTESWDLGKRQAEQEIITALGSDKALYTKIKFASLEEVASRYIDVESFTMAGNLSRDVIDVISREISNGIKYSKSTKEVELAIYEALASKGLIAEVDIPKELAEQLNYSNPSARITTTIVTSTFSAINEARYAYFTDDALGGFVEALEYSAILDSRTTDICQELDGKIYPLGASEWNKYRPPNHFNCRSILVAVTQRDTWETSVKPTIQPAIGFK